MALSRAASAAARPNDRVQRHRLRHALEIVAAALVGDEQACDLALHPRRNYDRTRLGQCLRPRRDVWHFAEYLAPRVYYYWTGIDGDASGKPWLAATLILAVKTSERPLDRECCPHRALGIVFLRHRIAE